MIDALMFAVDEMEFSVSLYSGRGMFGESCFCFNSDPESNASPLQFFGKLIPCLFMFARNNCVDDEDDRLDDFFEEITQFFELEWKTDSLGFGWVIYCPELKESLFKDERRFGTSSSADYSKLFHRSDI